MFSLCFRGMISFFAWSFVLVPWSIQAIHPLTHNVVDAIGKRNHHLLDRLIHKPNFLVNEFGNNQMSHLHHAILMNDEISVQLLLNVRGIDVNIAEALEGQTPLMYAVRYGKMRIVELLLKDERVQMKWKKRSTKGQTAFDLAVQLNKYNSARKIASRALWSGKMW